MKKLSLILFSLLMGVSVVAKEVETGEVKTTEEQMEQPQEVLDSRDRTQNVVALGVGVAFAEKIYKTDNDEMRILPNINVRQDNFYIRGVQVGTYLYEDESMGVAFYVETMGRFRVKKSDMKEGYRNIDERKDRMMYGMKLEGRNLPYGIRPVISYEVGVEGSKGDLVVGKPYRFGQKLMLFPAVYGSIYSNQMIGYYFGVTEAEVNRSTTDRLDRAYDGDVAYMYGARLSADYMYTEHVNFSASVGIQQFSNEIKNSPIVENGTIAFGALGIRYRF